MMQNVLKIALVLETSGGGSGRHVLDLAQGLANLGHKVTVIWSPVRAQDDFRQQLFALEQVTNIPLEMHRSVGAADFTSLRALAKVLREAGPFDVLHGHSSKAGALIRLLPRKIPGRRIYTPHAFRTMDPTMGARGAKVYGTIERLLASRADQIIAVSGAEKNHAIELGICPEKVTTVVNGAALPSNADRGAARKFMSLSEDDVAVGFIGRLDDQKAPLRFVQAVSLASQHASNIKGIVVGDGQLRSAAETQSKTDSVKFLGWQDGPALFPGLDIFCMTSHYEAMPYTLVEALHAGIPIVTTAVGGVDETVADGENGFVLATDCSAEELSECLVLLAQDADKRTSFGAHAKVLAQKRTIDVMVAETVAVYRAGT
ncbi:MAG: glycosyltransferase [Roseobacter sp.]